MKKLTAMMFAGITAMTLTACQSTQPVVQAHDLPSAELLNDCESLSKVMSLNDQKLDALKRQKKSSNQANAASIGIALLSLNPGVLAGVQRTSDLDERITAIETYQNQLAIKRTAMCSQ